MEKVNYREIENFWVNAAKLFPQALPFKVTVLLGTMPCSKQLFLKPRGKRASLKFKLKIFLNLILYSFRCGQTYFNQTKNGGHIIFNGDTLDTYCIFQIKAPIGWVVKISIPQICVHVDDQLFVHDSYGKQWLA